ASVWLAVAFGLLIPCGAAVPILIPALAATAAVGWGQAILWSPLPVLWLRLLLICASLYGIGGGPFLALGLGVRPDVMPWLLVTLLALAYPAAVLGVRVGRGGAGSCETVRVDRGEVRHPSVSLAPFSSSLRAQLWLEWRYLGWASLVQALIMLFG